MASSAVPIRVHHGTSYDHVVKPVTSVYHSVPPAVVHHTTVVEEEPPEPYDPNPEYHYSYGVNDPETGDQKHAEESLHNGVVTGSYSLTEPDGSIRTVTYTADKVNGFNAVVEKSSASLHPSPAVVKYTTRPLKLVDARPQVIPAKYIAPATAAYVSAPIVAAAAAPLAVAPAIYHHSAAAALYHPSYLDEYHSYVH